MKTMIYKTRFNKNGTLDIKGLTEVYSDVNHKKCIVGSVGILYQPYNGEDDADVYGLYLSKRELPDEAGNVQMTFRPLLDYDGNHILLKGEHLVEVPFAVLKNVYNYNLKKNYVYIQFEHH